MAPWLAERLGRRLAMGAVFRRRWASPWPSPSATCSTLPTALTPFFVLIFFLGIGGANFAMYTLWLPEQYTTDCRASAIAFVSSVGRFVGVAMVFLVGAGDPVLRQPRRAGRGHGDRVFVIGLLLLPFAVETRGKALPDVGQVAKCKVQSAK